MNNDIETESETIILLNDGDLKAGYFSFSTSKAVDFKKLCRRIGGEDLLKDLAISYSGKKITMWSCKVPTEFFNKGTFAIGKKAKRNFTPEHLEALKQRFKK